MLLFIKNIFTKYLIETEDNRLIIVSNEMKPLHELYFGDIVHEYKISHGLANIPQKNDTFLKYINNTTIENQSLQNDTNSTYNEVKDIETGRKSIINYNSKNIKLNELKIDNSGNLFMKNEPLNYNILDFLSSSFVYKNISISSRVYIFNHFILFPEIHKTKKIILPIIGIEIFFKDLITNEVKQILKSQLNTRNITFLKINPKIIESVFSSKNESIKSFNEKIKTICNFKECKSTIQCNLGYIEESKLVALSPNIFPSSTQSSKEQNAFYKYFTLFLGFLTFIFFIWRYFLKRHYKFETHVSHLKGYNLLNAVFDSRNVLIKRYKKNDKRLLNEMKILSLNLSHSIIKYHFNIKHMRSVDLVFTRPNMSLRQYVKSQYDHEHDYKDIKKVYYNDTEFFNKLLTSLNALHDSGIIFNNLSPESIFIENDEVFFYNFEDACLFEKGTCLIAPPSLSNIGTRGYQSPEILNKTLNLKNFEDCKASDRFSLCVIIYEMVYNKHPFHDYFDKKSVNYLDDIERNIKNNAVYLKWRVNIALHDLVSNAFTKDPKVRYGQNRFSKHPFFWSPLKSFEFIANVSDIIEKGDKNIKEVLISFENNQYKVFKDKWDTHLDKDILDKLKSSRVYHYMSLRSLLRAIRNGGRHYNDNVGNLVSIYKNFPNGYMTYYLKKFPYLLTTVYYSCVYFKDQELLRDYYPPGLFKDKALSKSKIRVNKNNIPIAKQRKSTLRKVNLLKR